MNKTQLPGRTYINDREQSGLTYFQGILI
jgi:hypothetical protein